MLEVTRRMEAEEVKPCNEKIVAVGEDYKTTPMPQMKKRWRVGQMKAKKQLPRSWNPQCQRFDQTSAGTRSQEM